MTDTASAVPPARSNGGGKATIGMRDVHDLLHNTREVMIERFARLEMAAQNTERRLEQVEKDGRAHDTRLDHLEQMVARAQGWSMALGALAGLLAPLLLNWLISLIQSGVIVP